MITPQRDTPEEMKHYEILDDDTGGLPFEKKYQNMSKAAESVSKIKTLYTSKRFHSTKLTPQSMPDPSPKLH